MRPEVATAVRAVGGGTWLLSFDARRTFQVVRRVCRPSGDGSLGQEKLGLGRFPDDRLVFGAALAVQP